MEVTMNQLELLWKLEKNKTALDEINRELTSIKQDEKMEYLDKRINNLKKRINELNNNLLRDRVLLKENQSRLNEYTYTINNMQEELYSGLITDLRQLDYLNKEKDKLKEEISSIETDILIAMEETEKMELETVHAETEIISINGEIEKLKISKSLLINALEIQIKEVEKESHIIESKIDKSHVNRFNVLRNTRQNSVVAVKNNICSGCNMRIPTNLNDILKAKNEVIFCESCGRILYYIEDIIEK